MPLRLYNTLTREIENFAPLDPDSGVTLYTCGPTVYDYAHIGNFRAYIFEDLLHRTLQYLGYRVIRVMNLTDVDDKTIRGATAQKISLDAYTAPYKKAFFEDLQTLRIHPADFYPQATDPENIAEMIRLIGVLLEKDIAYQAEDGSIYFRIARFPEYGKLAHLDLEQLRPSGRVSSDEYEKESVGDFALWKAWSESDGDVGWESPWGRGRPGWHIECSAMAMRLLGSQIDIHCGGVDNIFPHHEAEIAQCESCTGVPFARLWMHCAHLMVEGKKMAKSAGNFYTLRDLLDKGYSGREIRYVLLSARYDIPLNFTEKSLLDARSALQRIDAWEQRLRDLASEPSARHPLADFTPFRKALENNLNISAALGHLFDTIRDSNRLLDESALSPAQARAILDEWERASHILQLHPEAQSIPPEIIAQLLEERTAARSQKNWAESDRLRDAIKKIGWQVKDTSDGQELSPH